MRRYLGLAGTKVEMAGFAPAKAKGRRVYGALG